MIEHEIEFVSDRYLPKVREHNDRDAALLKSIYLVEKGYFPDAEPHAIAELVASKDKNVGSI